MATFEEEDLAMIAIILDEEEEHSTNTLLWIHEAWKMRETEGEFATPYKELVDDEFSSPIFSPIFFHSSSL